MYHVFAFSQFYPAGGIGDYVGSCSSYQEALELAAKQDEDLVEVLEDVGDKLVCVWSK
jgi:translation initiation factor IF-3